MLQVHHVPGRSRAPHFEVDPRAPATAGSEWLVTNGLGGYASGTVDEPPARRYHGVLIAALPNPLGRVMMMNAARTRVRTRDGTWASVGLFAAWPPAPPLALESFELELGLPVWRYRGGGVAIECRLMMVYGQNTTVIAYRLLGGAPTELDIRPALRFRSHSDEVCAAPIAPYPLRVVADRIEIVAPEPLPPLRLYVHGAHTFEVAPLDLDDLTYSIERERGYRSVGRLFSPGGFRIQLHPDEPITLIASTEPWSTLMAIAPEEQLAGELDRRQHLLDLAGVDRRDSVVAELVLAADQFLIRPVGRHGDHVRAQAEGEDAWSVIAGYHWFTDWGRDTMISLDGLALATGRSNEARAILRTFARHVRDGLVPNKFDEGSDRGEYHTADASLWYFHALDRYLQATGDDTTLVALLPTLRSIIDHHERGTRYGIGVDPDDGLLAQGTPGYPLTWMDARMGDWVVTPRRGKTVEINALWYNALRLMQRWLAAVGDAGGAAHAKDAADLAQRSYERRFWNPRAGYLFDVVDGDHGDDPACRPNQLFAISLPHAVLAREHWEPVLEAVERELVTPFGLRSLSPANPAFQPDYHGDRLSRDSAYHQGTVWSWLVGPYVDARLRAYPDNPVERARLGDYLQGLVSDLGTFGIGTIGEVFDAVAPYHPRGCIAQAWGVAELLRCLRQLGPRA